MMVQHLIIKISEAPNLIRQLYSTINKPALCFYCGKPAHYLQIVAEKQKHLLIRKICHNCEMARRKRWLKKL
jgi:hypothetical protein